MEEQKNENYKDKNKKNHYYSQKNRFNKQKNFNDTSDRTNLNFDYDNKSILSIIVPVYNEEDSIPELSLQLEAVLNKIAKERYEVIFIDDGSTDNSYSVIKKVHDRNNKFKAIRFRRNFGKAAALSAGFYASKGVIVITMDSDLQDEPEEISNLINKIKEGYDVVSGWKKNRQDPISKTMPSKLFNSVTSMVTGLKLHDFNCGLKAYRRDVVKNLNIYGEMHRYIPALAHFMGFKVCEIPVKHNKRKYGKSKYGFSRLIKGYLDLMTVIFVNKFFKRPMHFFGTIGSLFTFLGFVIDLYLVVEWYFGKTYLTNRPLALFGIALIIVGVQLFSMGLIAEIITKNSNSNFHNIKEKI
jgi:glycosyltransferase involved in cell wall biosynthesis